MIKVLGSNLTFKEMLEKMFEAGERGLARRAVWPEGCVIRKARDTECITYGQHYIEENNGVLSGWLQSHEQGDITTVDWTVVHDASRSRTLSDI